MDWWMVFGRWLCCRRGELGSRTGETASEGERGVGGDRVEGGAAFLGLLWQSAKNGAMSARFPSE